jgi:cell division transport system permease protein
MPARNSYRPEPAPKADNPSHRNRQRGARLKRAPARFKPRGYSARHAQSVLATLGRLWRRPIATLLSVVAIGIALALPSGMSVLVHNVRSLSGAFSDVAHMSVFLKQGVTDGAAHKLAADITRHSGVKTVTYISPDEALGEFRKHSGLGAALDALDRNPLPGVLVVTPLATDGAALAPLAKAVKQHGAVASVRLDTAWLKRLAGIIDIARRAALIVGVLLACGVIIIIGNTIRLDIENRRREIEVSKLIGATDRFIRRPFLYSGLWYGLGGGIVAFILVSVALTMLVGPVRHLAGLYGSSFSLDGPGASGFLLLVCAGAALGWLGAWLAVWRHLRDIEPS